MAIQNANYSRTNIPRATVAGYEMDWFECQAGAWYCELRNPRLTLDNSRGAVGRLRFWYDQEHRHLGDGDKDYRMTFSGSYADVSDAISNITVEFPWLDEAYAGAGQIVPWPFESWPRTGRSFLGSNVLRVRMEDVPSEYDYVARNNRMWTVQGVYRVQRLGSLQEAKTICNEDLSCYGFQARAQRHNTTQHNTTQHNTTQHNTTQHNHAGAPPARRSPAGVLSSEWARQFLETAQLDGIVEQLTVPTVGLGGSAGKPDLEPGAPFLVGAGFSDIPPASWGLGGSTWDGLLQGTKTIDWASVVRDDIANTFFYRESFERYDVQPYPYNAITYTRRIRTSVCLGAHPHVERLLDIRVLARPINQAPVVTAEKPLWGIQNAYEFPVAGLRLWDADAVWLEGDMAVTFTATRGAFTNPDVSGLTFTVGTGTRDPLTQTFLCPYRECQRAIAEVRYASAETAGTDVITLSAPSPHPCPTAHSPAAASHRPPWQVRRRPRQLRGAGRADGVGVDHALALLGALQHSAHGRHPGATRARDVPRSARRHLGDLRAGAPCPAERPRGLLSFLNVNHRSETFLIGAA